MDNYNKLKLIGLNVREIAEIGLYSKKWQLLHKAASLQEKQ